MVLYHEALTIAAGFSDINAPAPLRFDSKIVKEINKSFVGTRISRTQENPGGGNWHIQKKYILDDGLSRGVR